QAIALSIDATNFFPTLRLLSPTNSILFDNRNYDKYYSLSLSSGGTLFSLPASGIYVIEIGNYYSAGDPSSYRLALSSGAPGCTYAAAISSQNFGPTGGTGSVGVVAGDECN